MRYFPLLSISQAQVFRLPKMIANFLVGLGIGIGIGVGLIFTILIIFIVLIIFAGVKNENKN